MRLLEAAYDDEILSVLDQFLVERRGGGSIRVWTQLSLALGDSRESATAEIGGNVAREPERTVRQQIGFKSGRWPLEA
jgi:hypothetical protein